MRAFNFSATTANNMPSTLIKKQKPRYKPVNGIKRGFLFHIKVILFPGFGFGLFKLFALKPVHKRSQPISDNSRKNAKHQIFGHIN